MSVRVKICGITSSEDAACAADAGADALGFNFYPKSKRYVDPGRAADIVSGLPPSVLSVGIFVNEPPDRIIDIVSTVGLRAIQLSGDEPTTACTGLPVPVIRGVRVGAGFDVAALARWPVDALLLDADKAGSYGGTGETFDWSIAARAAQDYRVYLAGGLTPDNVAEAVKTVRPYAVDTASGVEKSPGVKDHAKILAFINAARKASENS